MFDKVTTYISFDFYGFVDGGSENKWNVLISFITHPVTEV